MIWPVRSARVRKLASAVSLVIITLTVTAACRGESGSQSGSTLDAVKQRGVLRAGIRFDNPPHSFIDERGRWVGFDVDIANAVAEQLGVSLEAVKVNELTRISYLKSGTVDVAVASMSHTIKRDEQIDFSQTYFTSKQTFLVRAGEVTSLADLIGKRVGMDQGSHAIGNWKEWLRSHGYRDEPEIVEFGSKEVAAQAVRLGAIAGWAEDYEILATFARRYPSLVVLAHEQIGTKQDGIGVRENDSKMRDAINVALQRTVTSGAYDRIYDAWFGPDSDTPVPRQGAIEVWPNG